MANDTPNKSSGNILGRIMSNRILGLSIAAVQLVASVILIALFVKLDVLPTRYFAIVVTVLLLLSAFVIFTQAAKKIHIFGKIFSIVMSILLMIVCNMTMHANDVIDTVSGADTKVNVVSVFVLSTSSANTVNDIAAETFGILATMDRVNTDNAIDKINSDLGTTISTKEYPDAFSLVNALYSQEVPAIIMNESFIEAIEEIQLEDGTIPYEFFRHETKKIQSTKIESQVDEEMHFQPTDVANEPFIVYLSGIDVEGPISTVSRSDVNILAVVNPKTYQILLLSTPRDYYVCTTVSGPYPDKLTHAGIYGIDCSMGTLGMLYDINVNYYFRVNSSTINTKAKLKNYLLKYFSQSKTDDILNKTMFGADKAFRDFNGKLYALSVGAGDFYPDYYLNKTTATLVSSTPSKATYKITVTYRYDPNIAMSNTSYGKLTETVTFVYENNKWVISNGNTFTMTIFSIIVILFYGMT